MSTVIWKSQLQLCAEQTIQIPRMSSFLHVDMQNGLPCVWYRVDPIKEMSYVNFYIFGTGHDIKDDYLNYIGTTVDGDFVWHIFYELLASDDTRIETVIVANNV